MPGEILETLELHEEGAQAASTSNGENNALSTGYQTVDGYESFIVIGIGAQVQDTHSLYVDLEEYDGSAWSDVGRDSYVVSSGTNDITTCLEVPADQLTAGTTRVRGKVWHTDDAGSRVIGAVLLRGEPARSALVSQPMSCTVSGGAG